MQKRTKPGGGSTLLDRKPEAVNHPSHYRSNGVEVIDVVEAFELNFRLGNAVKYILRAGRKGNRREDLAKARWYLNREIEKTVG